ISAGDLDALAEITFLNVPNAATPLVVNVTGTSFNGTTPNLAGISSGAAPFILWNFPDATSITVTGGDSIEGTLYAPNAALTWAVTQNIEGNVIAASFTHGPPPVLAQPREIHSLPFATEVSCSSAPDPPTGTLTLEKVVVNDGGTAVPADWTLTATGPATITGAGNSAAVTEQTVPAGDYTLSESNGPPGYEAGAWDCVGGTLTGDVVTIDDEATVVCTITNIEIVVPTPPDPDPDPDDPGGVADERETLPDTGTDVLPAGATGLALLLGGLVTLALSRRALQRRDATPHL
ncbi:MAG: collagen-binding domain-containing protein, partial [Microbacterium sp.]